MILPIVKYLLKLFYNDFGSEKALYSCKVLRMNTNEEIFMNILLTDKEKDLIKQRLIDVEYDCMGSNIYITKLRKIAYSVLSDRVLNILEQQRASLDPLPYIIFENMPIDDNIFGSPSFFDTGSKFKNGCISENLLCMIGAVLGEPYSIYFEGQELVNNLTPQVNSANDYTGLGSSVELDLHIENSALRFIGQESYSPLGLLLLGLRHQKSVINQTSPYTNIVDARQAIDRLSKHDLDILKKNNYILHIPYRWRKGFTNKKQCTEPCPMISKEGGILEVNAVFYPNMVTPMSISAENALNNFYNILKKLVIKLDITPGKLVYIDNRFSLHSRDKFIALYDNNGYPYRWLQRLFIMPNLWALQNFRKIGNRVFNLTTEM